MTQKKLYIINIVLLILTVPWLFIQPSMESFLGFPYWAFYSILATFIYALAILYFLNKYWFLPSSNTSKKK